MKHFFCFTHEVMMILSVTFSKPAKNIEKMLGKDFKRVKIKLAASSSDAAKDKSYFGEFYTEKQVFHKKFSEAELDDFIRMHAGTTFKNCVERTESEEITLMASKKGKITKLRHPVETSEESRAEPSGRAGLKKMANVNFPGSSQNRRKNYILAEGRPVPFLVRLGIMTAEGKVVSSKYDKFRQINRFLEFVDDVLPDVLSKKRSRNDESPLGIVDFGSGKSYLTFAVHYFLTEIKSLPCRIFGLDLKKDVIDYCSRLAGELGLENLLFAAGDIADFDEDKNPDIVITLHACDTATDYALDYSVRHGAKAILSVPCCQHEINSQLTQKSAKGTDFEIFSKYGLIKEKFSALLTDALRGDLLEQCGYKVQMLEFIDDSATPKNILIRAVKAESTAQNEISGTCAEQAGGNHKDELAQTVLEKLELRQTLEEQLKSKNGGL